VTEEIYCLRLFVLKSSRKAHPADVRTSATRYFATYWVNIKIAAIQKLANCRSARLWKTHRSWESGLHNAILALIITSLSSISSNLIGGTLLLRTPVRKAATS